VLTNLVRCCSAFAHTPTSPTSLDSRCSAFGCALGAPFNGQAIDAADTRPYFIAAIIQTSIPSAEPRFGMLRNLFQLLAPPSDHTIYDRCTRAHVINYWHQGASVLPVSLLTAPSEITRKIRPLQPEHAIWFRAYLRKANCVFSRNGQVVTKQLQGLTDTHPLFVCLT
jgi:hypothetical protein